MRDDETDDTERTMNATRMTARQRGAAAMGLAWMVGCALAAGCSAREGRVGTDDGEALEAGGDVGPSDVGWADARPNDAEVYTGPLCPVGHVTCYRGVRAVCSQDGSAWELSACPAGQVCERDACVPNPVQIALVVNPSSVVLGGTGTETNLDPLLIRAALDDACAQNPSCCPDTREDADPPPGWALPVLAKYWARRTLLALAEVPNTYAYLLGPPQSPTPEDPACVPNLPADAPLRACLEGTKHVIGGSEFNRQISKMAGVEDYYASGGLSGPPNEYVPLNPEELPSAWEDVPTWRELLVTAQGEPAQVEKWVNYRAERTDPELELANRYNPPPAAWRAHAVLSWLANEEGRPCKQSADCARDGQVCNAQGRCEDPAAACRVRDVVLIAPFIRASQMQWGDPPVEQVSQCGYYHDIDQPIWASWLRWGCACDEAHPCPAGAVCDTTWGEEQGPADGSTLRPHCVSEKVLPLSQPASTGGQLGWANDWVHNACDWLPSPQPVDSFGRPWHARVHSILVHTNSMFQASLEAGVVTATMVALLGDGVAVTPCPIDGFLFDEQGFLDYFPVASCDWQGRFAALIDSIAEDARHVCSLEEAGVPASLPADALVP